MSDLRGFTTHSDAEREEVLIAELVDASVRFVSHEWGTTVQLQKDFVPDLRVVANKNKLIQVCVNLLENSLDAMKGKTYAEGEHAHRHAFPATPAAASTLVFHDNGPGIPPESLGKIFDPFFTTKDVGDGMGMGLSICYRIIQQFEGDILVKSEPGKIL